MPSSSPTSYPYPFASVWDALGRVLPHLGFQILGADPATGLLRLRGGTGSIMSVGENLSVRAGSPDPHHTVVVIESGIRLGVATYARTRSNFDSILGTLGQYLDQHYTASRAPDAPPIGLPPPPSAPPPTQATPAAGPAQATPPTSPPGSDPTRPGSAPQPPAQPEPLANGPVGAPSPPPMPQQPAGPPATPGDDRGAQQ